MEGNAFTKFIFMLKCNRPGSHLLDGVFLAALRRMREKDERLKLRFGSLPLINLKEERNSMGIKIGILGYGNLGKGVECAVRQNSDMELAAIFTRRDPKSLKVRTSGVKVLHIDALERMQEEVDVLILCGENRRSG